MKSHSEDIRFSWAIYSLAIFFLFSLFQVMQWPLLPKFLDIYYHLSVMKGFHAAGGYSPTAFWECAPVGRPHLYPPALHIFMLGLYELGFSEIFISRFVDVLFYPLLLFVLGVVLTRIFGARKAFFTLLLFSSSYPIYLSSVTLPAFTLALIFGLFAFSNFERGRIAAAAVGIGICFYTHTLAGGLMFFSFIFYGFANRDQIKPAFLASLAGLFLAAPILIHQFLNRGYFQFVRIYENNTADLDIGIFLLSLYGAWVAKRKKGSHLFPLAMITAMALLAPAVTTYRSRFFSGQGLMGFVWLGGFALDDCFERFVQGKNAARKGVLFILLVTLFFYTAAPLLQFNFKERRPRAVFFDRSLMRYLLPDEAKNFAAKGFTIYFAEPYAQIAKIVKDHTEAGDILWSNFNYAGGIIALLAERSSSSSMLPEVRPYRPFDPLKAARILIWFKDRNAQSPKDMAKTVQDRGLRFVAETDYVTIYENTRSHQRRRIEKAVLKTPFLIILLVGVIFFATLTVEFWVNCNYKCNKEPER